MTEYGGRGYGREHTGWMASAPRLMAAAMMLGMLRYDSELGASPMHTASSASCGAGSEFYK